MAAAPLISVITVVYNGARHIKNCIDNVQQQGFRNFEHLIVDGCSTDATVAIAKEQEGLYSNLRVISEPDKGVYDAMNKGIAYSKGQWLFFLGCDDYFYSNNALEGIAGQLLVQPVLQPVIVYGNVWHEKLARIYNGETSVETLLKSNICHQAMFFNRAVYDTMGLHQLRFKQQADYDFNLRCWLSGKVKTVFVPVTVAFFADGGISAAGEDPALYNEMPELCIQYLLSGEHTAGDKMNILAKIYRKTMLRYGAGRVIKNLLVFRYSGYRLLALAVFVLSIPYYWILKQSQKK
ncbi:Glycosyl transferase family 2 [Filimonas lacunae]|uniref:Glycosyl transferase family 2 n=1 Tax=Filimonas lacunae TaxID=477680 RepID=A0A173MIE2_9BACT|nr:glycosyltransferase family 2 protein [Filimonas lacunae]BAV07191.1 colanic acid biosynthesis glycosyl transferase WcaE [Filimonas lacunae]SIS93514.1 Glycosyl transferase family 2 [Filimonas lacunae]